MASIGDLVVGLKVNTTGFNTGISKSARQASQFGKNVERVQSPIKRFGNAVVSQAARAKRAMAGLVRLPGRIGNAFLGAGRGVGSFFALFAAGATAKAMLGLATDAEQLHVKFRVLLKSGTAATAMLKNVGEFAASTPFQKMDIANAAQKLLAFNVPAKDVMTSIRQIGDISALTGNSITEMAELYGKANVQGRLFMEDINQLTGRGIPIIQSLASQFGVTESAVRGLVTSGQVTATNLQAAFAQMTAAGGQFAGGMDQLSQTTGGKLSTLWDKALKIATGFATKFLPLVNTATDGIAAGFEYVEPYVNRFGDFAVETAGAISTRFAALQQQLGVPVVTALTMGEYAFNNFGTIAELAARTALLHVTTFANTAYHFFTVVIPAGIAWFADNWKDVFKTSFNFVSTGFMNVAKNIQNLWASVLDFIAGNGFEFEWTPLLDGFKSTIKQMPDIPPRVMGEIESKLASDVARLGTKVGAGFQNMLKPRLAELAKMQKEAASKATKTAVKSAETMKKAAARAGGKNDFANAAKKQTGEVKFAGAMQRGSDSAITAVLKAQMTRNNPQVKAADKTTKAVKQAAKAIVGAVKQSGPVIETQGAV